MKILFKLLLITCLLSAITTFGAGNANSLIIPLITNKFSSPNEASRKIGQMARLLQDLQDRRSLFPNIYALTIESANQKLVRGEFHNPKWVQSLIVNYANLYRRTILLELTGQRSHLPVAWQNEFLYVKNTQPWVADNNSPTQWVPMQDVVYGINVHIARDLVEALFVTPTDFNSDSVREDYFLITQALKEAMPQIWAVYKTYDQPLPFASGFEQSVASNWIGDLRAIAWENARNGNRFNAAGKKSILDMLDKQVATSSRRHGALLIFLAREQPLQLN